MTDLLALAGAALVGVGAYLIYPPLAIVWLGLALIALAYIVEAARVDHRPPPG
jgi:uncharacterized membrane protein